MRLLFTAQWGTICTPHKILFSGHIINNDLARARGTYGEEERCLKGFGKKQSDRFLRLWLRTSLIYINNCPTRCNTKHPIYNSASSLYMFRLWNTPIISSIQNCNDSILYSSYFLCSCLPPTWPSCCTVPEAVVTVLCAPDNGCVWHPKHVEWTCRIINRLLCAASRWTFTNIEW